MSDRNPKSVWNRGGSRNVNRANPQNSSQFSGEKKFREAQIQLQASVQKHIKEFDYSSEEEDLESNNILDTVLRNYSQTTGQKADLGRTQQFIENIFLSGAATCLICIASVKRSEAIWSCLQCYCFFHLQCIQRWAKDSIVHQKLAHEDLPRNASPVFKWGCPKCRYEYDPENIPKKYDCFCGKTTDPPFHPWQIPHSCGENCEKPLLPDCGHKCLLLCHPGPCPPCPKTVRSECYCKVDTRLQRCSTKDWSCGKKCNRLLSCGRHSCVQKCHSGECAKCPKQSQQKCDCGDQTQMRECASPHWKCEKTCNKFLSCGNHKCEEKCHSGPCGDCPNAKTRFCPCEKTTYQLPCTEEVPTCGDTCAKMLDCGAHKCSERCHRSKCGTCREVVTKTCRCGLHTKEVQCSKEYLCDVKCKNIKDCFKHPCNRKCCDGNCPPCDKLCDKTLRCGAHKCSSACHRGPCYPCPRTAKVKCRCGQTSITVPCGKQKKTHPPRCSKPCRTPPNCHHPKREAHNCHFASCPPCEQVCNKPRTSCDHLCPIPCHSAVKFEDKPLVPFEQHNASQRETQCLPCPECVVPVSVTCLGGHETADWPCHLSQPSSCQRSCGRRLQCGNHSCSRPCHVVENASNENMAGANCETCETGCLKPRPEGCTHTCPKPCHPGLCPPCKHIMRIKCHCGLNQLYVPCGEWTLTENQDHIKSCGNQCPKNYSCGHRCKSNCHSGSCPDEELCHKKVKVYCSCRRLRKDFHCEMVRNGNAIVECDEVCLQKKEELQKTRELELQQKKLEEEQKNQREIEEFEKKFHSKKKYKKKREYYEDEEVSLFKKYWYIIPIITIVLFAIFIVMKE